jgi:SAM-dependent methyltransferase
MDHKTQNETGKVKGWFQQPGHRLLDGLFVVMLCFFSWIGWQLVQNPTFNNVFLLCVLIYVAARVLYELVFNRGNPPTLAADFWSRRKLAALVKQDADGKPKENFTVVDLGSGNGEVSRHIARAVPHARVVGVEWGYLPWLRSRWWAKIFGPTNVEYTQQDFFKFDCSMANCIVMYLNWKIAQTLGAKLWNELKPGSTVISHSFELKGPWPAPEVVTFYTPFQMKVFIYRR